MWAMLVVGMLFLAGATYNVFGPEPDLTEAAGGAAIAAVLIALFVATRYHQKQADEFEGWLTQNANAIERGGARYRDVLVTPATVLTQFQVAVSFLIVTFRFPTRIYIVGNHATGMVAALCTVISLVLGWRGIPWGPIYTLQVVARNLRGGLRQTVGERLSAAPAVVRTGNTMSSGSKLLN